MRKPVVGRSVCILKFVYITVSVKPNQFQESEKEPVSGFYSFSCRRSLPLKGMPLKCLLFLALASSLLAFSQRTRNSKFIKRLILKYNTGLYVGEGWPLNKESIRAVGWKKMGQLPFRGEINTAGQSQQHCRHSSCRALPPRAARARLCRLAIPVLSPLEQGPFVPRKPIKWATTYINMREEIRPESRVEFVCVHALCM